MLVFWGVGVGVLSNKQQFMFFFFSWFCLRSCFTLYHGKSPVFHDHLGGIFLELVPNTKQTNPSFNIRGLCPAVSRNVGSFRFGNSHGAVLDVPSLKRTHSICPLKLGKGPFWQKDGLPNHRFSRANMLLVLGMIPIFVFSIQRI